MVQHTFKEEIAEKMEATGLTSSDKGWIQKFQLAVSEVIQSIGGEEAAKEQYGPLAKAWNEQDLPEDMRRK